MKKSLVIVEAPGKLKTISGFLGSDYKIVASVGHFKNLSPTKDAVTVEEDKSINFKWIEDKKKTKNILDNIKNVEKIYLATDLDREGEAIAWHLENLIRSKNKTVPISRISFVEITKKAITESLKHERDVNKNLVSSYLARVGLDHQVGFSISPILWQKLPVLQNQSAGRVQSPALKLLVEKEFERNLFSSMKYYSVVGYFCSPCGMNKFEGKLIQLKKEKINDKYVNKKFLEDEMPKIDKSVTLTKITKKNIKIKPEHPFVTSSLQQEAYKILGIKVADIMKIAQTLYEGVSINGKNTALITYMRTDSVNISNDFLKKIHEYLKKNYPEYKSDKVITYKNKVKNAQEAHECIRPTYIELIPESIKTFLSSEQYNLYSLIWKRTMATQMIPQEKQTKTFILENKDSQWTYSNTIVTNAGFTSIYEKENTNQEVNFKENDQFVLNKYDLKEHETQPPARFSEASLIKELEKYGIGRPSTYAGIIEILQKRLYVEKKNKNLIPTSKGKIVTCFLKSFFSDYVDYKFTEKVEDSLDSISNGETNFEDVLQEFCINLYKKVDEIKNFPHGEIFQTMGKLFIEGLQAKCKCGGELELRMKFSFFFYCQKCQEATIFNREEDEIDTDVKHVKTDKYQYLMKNNQKIFLPAKFNEEITPDDVDFLVSLPKIIGTHKDDDITLGMSKYGFYVKNNNVYATVSYAQSKNLLAEQAIIYLNKKRSYGKKTPRVSEKKTE